MWQPQFIPHTPDKNLNKFRIVSAWRILLSSIWLCVRNTSWKTLELRLLAQILEQIFKFFFFFFFFFFSFFFCFCSQGIRFSMIAICWRSIPSTRYYPGIFPTHYVNSLPLALSPLYPTSPLVHSIARSCSGSQRNWASWMTTTQYELISLTPTPLLPLYNPPFRPCLHWKKCFVDANCAYWMENDSCLWFHHSIIHIERGVRDCSP